MNFDSVGHASADKVFFLVFDQTEGRDELFEDDKSWNRFFAHLSELYNFLPNVFILFTMTIERQAKLSLKMEQQFKDRMPLDNRLRISKLNQTNLFELYRQRVYVWLLKGALNLPVEECVSVLNRALLAEKDISRKSVFAMIVVSYFSSLNDSENIGITPSEQGQIRNFLETCRKQVDENKDISMTINQLSLNKLLEKSSLPFRDFELGQIPRHYDVDGQYDRRPFATIRQTLRSWDLAFRNRLVEIDTTTPVDYQARFNTKWEKADKQSVSMVTRKHNETLCSLLNSSDLMKVLGERYGVMLGELKEREGSNKVKALVLEFRSVQSINRWVKIYYFRYSKSKLKNAIDLLSNRQKDRYRLAIAKPTGFQLSKSMVGDRGDQIIQLLIRKEDECHFSTAIEEVLKKEGLRGDAKVNHLRFLATKMLLTYLDDIFSTAGDLLKLESDEEVDDQDEDEVKVVGGNELSDDEDDLLDEDDEDE